MVCHTRSRSASASSPTQVTKPTEIGAEIWGRTFEVHHEDRVVQARERYFLVRCEPFTPSTEGLEALQRSWFRAFRWWHVTELSSSSARTSPDSLPALVRQHVGG